MCLTLLIEAPEAARPSLDAVARSLPPGALPLHVAAARKWSRVRSDGVKGSISEEGGCACSLLTDDADWAAPFWSMRPEVLEPLARTLETIGEAILEGFVVAAIWSGDSPSLEQVVSPERLIALARTGRLGTRTRYRVPPRFAQAT